MRRQATLALAVALATLLALAAPAAGGGPEPGAGFMRGGRVERIYRDVKVMMIGGGSEEIMYELAARQLRLG